MSTQLLNAFKSFKLTTIFPSLPKIVAPSSIARLSKRGYATEAGELHLCEAEMCLELIVRRGEGLGHYWRWRCRLCRCHQSRPRRTESMAPASPKSLHSIFLIIILGYMYRKTRHFGRNMLECWLYSLKSSSQQLPPLPPNPPRHKG